jgi:SAM-dependent methyltransferase
MDSDADKIIDLYDRHAHDYVADRRYVGWNESAWLERFGALLRQGSSILDIGCGSGAPVAKYLIDQGFAVDGVDS